MHEAEIHDLSDDADYAASIQQQPARLNRTDSGKESSSSELEGAEIVYLKDNVTIHTTQYASEGIGGRLKLIKQGSSLFMTWIPYRGQNSNDRMSEKEFIYHQAVPFSDIRSIRRHTPTLGWQFIIVVMSSGLAFPPLYFYNGGVREFLATMKQHIVLARSSEDANVFLVNDFKNPLQRSLSSLELPRAVSIANTPSPAADEFPSSTDQVRDTSSKISASNLQRNGKERIKHQDPARDLPIQGLEKSSLATRLARETTQIFRDSNIHGSIRNDGRKNEQSNSYYNPITSATDFDIVRYKGPVPSDPLEFDKLSLVWGKPRQPPLGSEEWINFLDSEGRVKDSGALRKRIFYGGVEHNMRKEVWTFLLGCHSYESTYAEREYLASVKKAEYETIKRQWQSISSDQSKRFTKFRERRALIDKDVVRTDRSHSFYDGDDNSNVSLLRDILLTYSFYNFDLGYCQGMGDLLSPILFVTRDESKSFWCFVSLMERLGPNFNRDQSGMHSQLFALSKLVELLDGPLHNYFKQNDCLNYFFCFRWILIQFKREFEYEKMMRMWEVLWTHYLSEHLHLYVCVAILKRYRSKMIGEQMDFDTLLKFINELSDHIDLDTTLRNAEALCICAGENGAACIPPGTPPALPIEDGSIYFQPDDDIL